MAQVLRKVSTELSETADWLMANVDRDGNLRLNPDEVGNIVVRLRKNADLTHAAAHAAQKIQDAMFHGAQAL